MPLFTISIAFVLALALAIGARAAHRLYCFSPPWQPGQRHLTPAEHRLLVERTTRSELLRLFLSPALYAHLAGRLRARASLWARALGALLLILSTTRSVYAIFRCRLPTAPSAPSPPSAPRAVAGLSTESGLITWTSRSAHLVSGLRNPGSGGVPWPSGGARPPAHRTSSPVSTAGAGLASALHHLPATIRVVHQEEPLGSTAPHHTSPNPNLRNLIMDFSTADWSTVARRVEAAGGSGRLAT
jgi:hypothetical protein